MKHANKLELHLGHAAVVTLALTGCQGVFVGVWHKGNLRGSGFMFFATSVAPHSRYMYYIVTIEKVTRMVSCYIIPLLFLQKHTL